MSRGYTFRLAIANKRADGRSPGVKLGRFCIEQDISVREVAKEFGVSRMTIYKWFTGEWFPRKPAADQIVLYLLANSEK
jgi:transcriptional regulator with XRE-family HTH domain